MSALRQLVGPLTLLTFCTSFAFNRAALDRVRRDEESLHARRLDWLNRVLEEEVDFLSSVREADKARSSWGWGLGWASGSSKQQDPPLRSAPHDLDLIRQSLSLSLNPSSLGLPPHLISQLTTLVSRTRDVGSTSWTTALFGDINVIGESFRRARTKAREALFGGDGLGQEELSVEQTQKRAREEEEEERRIREWEKNMLEAEAAAAKAALAPPPPAPVTSPIYTSSAAVQAKSSASRTSTSSQPAAPPSSGQRAAPHPTAQTAQQPHESTAGGARRFYV